MAEQSRNDLYNRLPDNNEGLIQAADVRAIVESSYNKVDDPVIGTSGFSGYSGYSVFAPCGSSWSFSVDGSIASLIGNYEFIYEAGVMTATLTPQPFITATLNWSPSNAYWVFYILNENTLQNVTYFNNSSCPRNDGWQSADVITTNNPDIGISGISGFSGRSGYSGAGSSGFSGYSGRSGYSGYSGISGATGAGGSSGFSGYSGATGPTGAGTSGFSGYSGRSGYSGYSGISGATGAGGSSGFSGYSGISGATGAGTSGFSGYSGRSGYSGASTSGFSGYSGRSGYSGTGVSGFSGYSGISGFSGFSGYSGRSGYSGISGQRGCANFYELTVTGISANLDGVYQFLFDGESYIATSIPSGVGLATLSIVAGLWTFYTQEDLVPANNLTSTQSNTCPNGEWDFFEVVTTLDPLKGLSGFSGRSGYSGAGVSGFSGYSGAGSTVDEVNSILTNRVFN